MGCGARRQWQLLTLHGGRREAGDNSAVRNSDLSCLVFWQTLHSIAGSAEFEGACALEDLAFEVQLTAHSRIQRRARQNLCCISIPGERTESIQLDLAELLNT